MRVATLLKPLRSYPIHSAGFSEPNLARSAVAHTYAFHALLSVIVLAMIGPESGADEDYSAGFEYIGDDKSEI